MSVSAASASPLVDELDHLATVEHALCVLYLWFHCALGDVVEPGPAGGQAGLMAQDQMRRIRGTNRALVRAGGTATVGRATHVRNDAGAPVELPTPEPGALDTFLNRCGPVTAALDGRYGHLGDLAVSVEPSVREEIDAAVATGVLHTAELATLRDGLAGLGPAEYIRVRPAAVPVAGTAEAGLQRLGDLYYRTIVEAVRLGMTYEDDLGDLIPSTTTTMFKLEEVHRKLAERGHLPTFTLADPAQPAG